MAHCELCGKHTVFGGKSTRIRGNYFTNSKRKVKPNLQRATLKIDGRERQITACARCIRTAHRIRQ